MLNPTAWNWGAKAGFFWAAAGALCTVWTYFLLPEPKGRSYAEMDILFEARIGARKFRETSVESFGTVGTGGHNSETGSTTKVALEQVEKVGA
jgi:SP family general alpha glucoside:H+ symporter-like MFS transporter